MPSKSVKKNPIHWAMWANVLGVYAGSMMILGGFLSQFGFARSSIGIAVMVCGAVVLTIEWPRGKRSRGSTLPRQYQRYFTPLVAKFGVVTSNYFFRGVIWLCFAIPAFFVFPTIVGGLTLVVSSLVYIFAAFKEEHWVPLIESKRESKPKMYEAPTKAPPRLPTQSNARKLSSMEPDQSHTTINTSLAPSQSPAPTSSAPTRPVPRPKPRQQVAPNKFEDWHFQSALDPASGQTYYIDTKTDSSQWDKPPLWDEYCKLYGEPKSDSVA